MPTLQSQIEKTLPRGMEIPKPIKLLFQWIEKNKFVIKRGKQQIGLLYPLDKIKAGRTETEEPDGTYIEFYAETGSWVETWFGEPVSQNVLDRLCVFAKTGADGSVAAFWLDDKGKQRIVHMGSGSGSVLTCILATDPVDFLRLLAIGYLEIAWSSEFSKPPNAGSKTTVLPNVKFQEWVKKTFSVTIPKTAAAIVKHPDGMDDESSADPFWQWTKRVADGDDEDEDEDDEDDQDED